MQRPLEKFPYHQCGGDQVWHNRNPGGARAMSNWPTVLASPSKEEGGSGIPSSQRQAVMDRGHSPNSEEVVIDTSQVVVGTSQESGGALGCQPI